MQFLKLSDCAYFSNLRTSEITLENYISTENMLPDRGGIILATSLPPIKTAAKYERNDILISNIRPYFKKIWYADHCGSCSNDVLVIKAKNEFVPLFLYYVLSDDNFFNYATVTSQGAKMPRGTPNAIMKYLVPNMTKCEQGKVADILSKYDAAIENNNKRIAILEQMAGNLYKEWFVRFRFPGYDTIKFENGLPVGWPIKKIKNCVRRLPFGRLYKAYELQSEGRIIVVDQSTEAYLGFHDNTPSHFANYDAPIILFGDHTCKFQLMCKDFSLGENVVPFVASNTGILDNYYLYYAMRKLVVCEEYKRHWNNLINLKIFVPPMAIQRLFAEQLCIFEKEKERLFRQNLNLTKQRNMLLPRLINGTLEIKL